MVRRNQLIFTLSGTVFDYYMVHFSVDKYISRNNAKNDGMNSIIGGETIAFETALSHNMPATFIKISKYTMLKAIEQSTSIIGRN